ncbi:TetR/AcrR family transcriptional regulator [Nakamurella sp. PAMC28650]|uniref:TetR/AcrR family transcriptional regulator n=1 Tax=Nakamurella sp. PAMC28650 TaxID=2762325 RepID=UPI00164D477E|nr:TetR/AcrR family transcriptional regulator [Nakamurella sp. PAMC28650]QNK79352.1 TetR/AcrR family transcriptional regulator [Nakamurella sp. PAMC28650]
MTATSTVENRGERRRARTRAALVAAARELLAREDGTESSIQEITDLADVGFGSFYNHFPAKTDLFDTAIAETLEEHGAMLDELTADIDDPAEVFATSVRLTARLPKTHPQMARIIRNTGATYLAAETGLAPRARRDILAARDSGRFTVGDPVVALACVGGALLGVLNLAAASTTSKAVDRAADQLALNLLSMFDVPREDAERICSRHLPTISGRPRSG